MWMKTDLQSFLESQGLEWQQVIKTPGGLLGTVDVYIKNPGWFYRVFKWKKFLKDFNMNHRPVDMQVRFYFCVGA